MKKDQIRAILAQLSDDFANGKVFRIKLMSFSDPMFGSYSHECSYIESEVYDFKIHYTRTTDFFFFEGATPWGGLGHHLFKIRAGWLPEGLKKVLKEAALNAKETVIKLDSDVANPNIKLLLLG